MPDSLPDLLTAKEVADLLRISRGTVHRWTITGKLVPIASPSRNHRFRREDVEAMLAPRDAA